MSEIKIKYHMAFITIVGTIFWPREMMRLIGKFRAEGTLNKQALLDYCWMTCYMTALFALLPYLFWSPAHPQLTWITALLLPVLVRWCMWQNFYKYSIIYVYGAKEKATVKGVRYVGAPGYLTIIYELDQDKRTLNFNYVAGRGYDKSYFPKVGDSVFVYWYPEGRYKIAPASEYFLEKFSLSTVVGRGADV